MNKNLYKNVYDVFTKNEVEGIKKISVLQQKIDSLTDEFCENPDIITKFDFEVIEEGRTMEEMYITNPFIDCEGWMNTVDPVQYYGKSFLDSDFLKLPHFRGDDNCNRILNLTVGETSLLKKISQLQDILVNYLGEDTEECYSSFIYYLNGEQKEIVNPFKDFYGKESVNPEEYYGIAFKCSNFINLLTD